MTLVARIGVGFVTALAVAFAARRAGSLSASGARAATFIGTAAVAAGWDWAALLILYFVSATFLSRAGRRGKLGLTASVIAKAGPRDAVQVMSNGLPFALAALATAGDVGPGIAMAAAGGSLAASAADTWGTEIGTLVGHTPRSILTWRALRVGESGGITAAGSLASIAGAVFIGATALAIGWPRGLFVPFVIAGIAGSVADSIAGATLQRRSWCGACEMPTEMRLHTCGTATRHVGGVSFIENDAVNFGATVLGAIVAVLAARGLT